MLTAIVNIGKIVSGDIHKPVLSGDTIIIADEKLPLLAEKNFSINIRSKRL
jgi:hypothetical protein